jgi:hypothetical protein
MEGKRALLIWRSLTKGVAKGPKKKISLCPDHFGFPPESTIKKTYILNIYILEKEIYFRKKFDFLV